MLTHDDFIYSVNPEEAVEEMWDTSRHFPIPRRRLKCPICESRSLHIKEWNFFLRTSSPRKYRCDIRIKCCCCSAVWPHGIVIPKELFDHHRGQYDWRAAKKYIEEHGEFYPEGGSDE